MHIRPPDRLIRVPPPETRRAFSRRTLRWMIAGSVLVHLLALVAILLLHPAPPPSQGNQASDAVAVVVQSEGESAASTSTPDPLPDPTAAMGHPDGATDLPVPSSSTMAPQPAPEPPTQPPPPQVEASNQVPPPETPPETPAETQPETQPETPPQPAPPTPPSVPPTVSLRPFDDGEEAPPPFVMPQPPPVLPPLTQNLPRPPPRPRTAQQTVPRSPSGFPMPQNWSLSTGPGSLLTQRGTDLASATRGSKSDAEYRHVSGADPGEDWGEELHRWAVEHAYYPPQAVENGEEGEAVVQVTVNRYGKVLSTDLISRSGSSFLDMAWVGEWRNATVPRFPPGMEGDTTTFQYTIHYILIHRR